VFLNAKAIAVGALIAMFAKDIASNAAHNYNVDTFLGKSGLSFGVFLPEKYQEWPKRDVREALTERRDESGSLSCLHVRPVSPEYQITSTLEDGTKICCSLDSSSVLVPTREYEHSIEYFCGHYPNHQVVRVMK
jgi:hypothetical protein